MKILISSDTACDLPTSIVEKYNIPLIPLPITLGNDTFLDGIDVTPEKIYAFVEEHKILPKTSAINDHTYTEFFEKMSKEYDHIIHFTLSHKVSASNSNAVIAQKEFPKVHVIDTYALSSGMAVQIINALNMRDKGYTASQIVEEIEKNKNKVVTSFVIEKLDYLHKGGRCSGLQLLGANVLKLRPSIKMADGALQVHKKYKGKMDKVVSEHILNTLQENPTYDDSVAIIVHSGATEDMLEAARTTLKQHAKFKQVYETITSCTITSHCGKNTLGLVFQNK